LFHCAVGLGARHSNRVAYDYAAPRDIRDSDIGGRNLDAIAAELLHHSFFEIHFECHAIRQDVLHRRVQVNLSFHG
jgi:hypothetical protein